MKKLFLLLILFCTGCATLPGTISLSEKEEHDASTIFKRIIAKQKSCPCCLDADVSVTFQKMMAHGTLPGYLQAKAPGFLRFEGVNPLGMTETVLGTDGSTFIFLNVRQQKSFSGKLDAHELKGYGFAEYAASAGFYWLIGRFPPGPLKILQIEQDRDGAGYWAEVVYERGEKRSLVLFSGQEELIYQNISLNKDSEMLARFSYEYQSVPETQYENINNPAPLCRLPVRVTVDGNGNGTVSINFNKMYPGAEFSKSDFIIDVPNKFEREIVK